MVEESKKKRNIYAESYKNRYYDRIQLCVDKGERYLIATAAAAHGMGICQYIVYAINQLGDIQLRPRKTDPGAWAEQKEQSNNK